MKYTTCAALSLPPRWLYLVLIVITALLLFNSQGAFAQLAGYSYKKLIRIDNAQVSGTANHTNFPVLISHTDADLRTTGNGGHVENANGYDIAFTSADGVTQLDHEIEKYDATTGEYIAWVRVPTLSYNVDTDIYMYYGNSSVSTDPSSTATWNSNYTGVWHMAEDPSGTAPQITDGTSGSNDGTSGGTMTTADLVNGKCGQALDFDGNDDYIDVGTLGSFGSNINEATYQYWINTTLTTKFTSLGTINDGGNTAIISELNSVIPFGVSSEGDARFYIREEGGAEQLSGGADISGFNDGGWHSITAVVKSSSRIMEFYLDGTSLTSSYPAADGSPDTFADLQYGLAIGALNNRGTFQSFATAILDEVRISDVARSANWIATEYNNQNDPDNFYSVGGEMATTQILGYSFKKKITIDNTQVSGSSNLVDFPILISITDNDLKSVCNNGDVNSEYGYDIAFTADDGTTILDHDLESYDAGAGEYIAWVRIPLLDYNDDTDIYLQYGNPSFTSDPSSTGTWNSNYLGVWHLNEDVTDEQTSGTHEDGTANANDGSQNGNVEGTGKIGVGQDFDGTDDKIVIANPSVGSEVTISAWVKHDNVTTNIERYVDLGDDIVIRHDGANSVGQLHFYIRTGGGTLRRIRVNGVLSNGNWYHVVGTYDGTIMRLYQNGVELDTYTPPLSALDAVSGNSGLSQTSETLDGIIDEARVSNVALSADWIATEYNNQNSPGSFFSVGAEEANAAPGNVSTNLTLWLKSNTGTCGFPSVTIWTDQTINGNYTTASGDPQLVSNGTNYNPSIDFDATGDYFETTATSLVGSSNPYTKYVVIMPDVVGSVMNLIGTDATSNLEMRLSVADELKARHNGTGLLTGAAVVAGMPVLCGIRYGVGGTDNVVRVDGIETIDNTTAGFTDIGTTQIGGRWSGTNLFDGYITEAVVYDAEVTDADIVKIETYLAIKYGITLDNSAGGTAGDYVATDGTTIWDASDGSAYHNDIVVIGRDDDELLYQKQSKSMDDSLIVYLNTLAADNASNTGTISSDISYLVIGHNGARLAADVSEVPPGIYSKFLREWKVTNTNFTYSYSIEFEWEEIGAFDINDIRLLVDADGDFSDADTLGVSAGLTFSEGSIIVSGIGTSHIPAGSTRYISIGSVSSSTPLPIELVKFTATIIEDDEVQLTWQTASETNNDYFTVERSKDGVKWFTVTHLAGAGSSTSTMNYSVVDANPYSGISYYRLKQTDFDGQFTYSEIRVINLSEIKDTQIKIYPNPANRQLIIEGDQQELADVRIYNVLGANVRHFTSIVDQHHGFITLDISRLPHGVYTLRTRNCTRKMIKR